MSAEVTIWVVMGTTGECSDRLQWGVCAYRSMAYAQAHVVSAAAAARAIETLRNQTPTWTIPDEVRRANVWDPAILMYGATSYYLLEVPLRDDAPKEALP